MLLNRAVNLTVLLLFTEKPADDNTELVKLPGLHTLIRFIFIQTSSHVVVPFEGTRRRVKYKYATAYQLMARWNSCHRSANLTR